MFEVIACSVADAMAAEQGGAERIEVVSHLEVGGLTPPLALVREIQAAVKLPLRVMVREEENFFVSDAKKIERLCEVARSLADLSVDGLVLGFLTTQGGETVVAHEVLQAIFAAVPQTRVTFHRAFEEVTDPLATVVALKQYTQIDCILTSHGGRPDAYAEAWPPPWPERFNGLAALAKAAAPQIEILIGGGVTAEIIESLCQDTQNRPILSAIHLGQAVRAGHSLSGAVQSAQVQALVERWHRAN